MKAPTACKAAADEASPEDGPGAGAGPSPEAIAALTVAVATRMAQVNFFMSMVVEKKKMMKLEVLLRKKRPA